MLSPEGQAAVDADAARMRARARAGPSRAERFSGRSLGDFRLVEPGCELWSRVDGPIQHVRMKPDGGPVGGIVVDVLDAVETTDADTGEIELRRAFRTFDPSEPVHRAFHVLLEAQVDPDAFGPPQLGRIRSAYRPICGWVGAQRGNAGPFEVDAVGYAYRLAAIVGQRRP